MYSFTPTEEQQMLIDSIKRFSTQDLRVNAHDADEDASWTAPDTSLPVYLLHRATGAGQLGRQVDAQRHLGPAVQERRLQRVEIGTGSGYLTALLASMAGRVPRPNRNMRVAEWRKSWAVAAQARLKPASSETMSK